jgi:hypothetical protein
MLLHPPWVTWIYCSNIRVTHFELISKILMGCSITLINNFVLKNIYIHKKFKILFTFTLPHTKFYIVFVTSCLSQGINFLNYASDGRQVVDITSPRPELLVS